MRPLLIPLTAGVPTYAISSDNRLKVEVPGAAVTPQLVTKAHAQATSEHAHGAHTLVISHGGALAVQVIQVEGPSGGGATGDGEVTFGTYLFTLVDAYGQRVSASLAQTCPTVPDAARWLGGGRLRCGLRALHRQRGSFAHQRTPNAALA